MNPYIIPTTCSVCGGKGMLHACDVGADWLGEVRHRDPEVCTDNLRRERFKKAAEFAKHQEQFKYEG